MRNLKMFRRVVKEPPVLIQHSKEETLAHIFWPSLQWVLFQIRIDGPFDHFINKNNND